MKSHFAYWVALGLLASTSAPADSISISIPGDPNSASNTTCSVTGSSLQSDGYGGFVLVGGQSNNCGNAGGNQGPGTASINMSAQPASLQLNALSQPSSTITWTANVTGANCTVSGDTSNFSITQGSITPLAATTVGTATVQPLATAVHGNYSFTVTGCTFTGGQTLLNTPSAALTLTDPITNGSCSANQVSDTSYVLNRLCSASVVNPYLQSSVVTTLDQYGNIWGGWPVSGAVSGSARVITLAANQFVALAFQPSPTATIKINASSSYGGGTISVSTKPGGFTRGDTDYGVVCLAANGGSTNMTISSNGSNASCMLDPNGTYYLNISSVKATGLKGCLGATCNAAFTITQVN